MRHIFRNQPMPAKRVSERYVGWPVYPIGSFAQNINILGRFGPYIKPLFKAVQHALADKTGNFCLWICIATKIAFKPERIRQINCNILHIFSRKCIYCALSGGNMQEKKITAKYSLLISSAGVYRL